MRDRDLARHHRDTAEAVDLWVDRIGRDIAAKIEDAHAHAVKAVTDAAVSAPDGAKTLRAIQGGRSYPAGVRRLTELSEGLLVSLQEAREALLEVSYAGWSRLLGSGRSPNQAERRAFRGAVLHGYPLDVEVKAQIEGAKRRYRSAIAVAASRSVAGRESAMILRTWETLTRRTLTTRVRLLVSDSAVFAETVATWYLVPPSERPETEPPLSL